jgi:GH15 family glucan-1,4-alpha-glucosidase
MAQQIENHGIVGNLRTAALIGLDGRVNFLCWPQFDSPSIFASLLDDERGGCFELIPLLDDPRHRQLYLPDTNVLLTRFLSADGVAEISDFMSIGDPDAGSRLVRRVKTVHGTVRFRMRCMPGFDYARADHKVYAEAGTVIFTGSDNLALRLRASVPIDISNGAALAEFDLAAGDTASFVLEDAPYGTDSVSADPGYVSAAFKETSDFWRSWVRRSSYRGRWREIVTRSALALKLLTSSEHGSMIAALTFGNRRDSKLGLPLHLAAGCRLYRLRFSAPRACGGGERVCALARRTRKPMRRGWHTATDVHRGRARGPGGSRTAAPARLSWVGAGADR